MTTFTATQCPIGCTSTGSWCIRGTSCNYCYSDNCAVCNGYSLQECTKCTDSQYSIPECGLVGLNCQTGGLFSCTNCGTFTLIDGLCLESPFEYNPNTLNAPVVDAQFDTFKMYYDVFSSGADPTTYSPWNMGAGTDSDPIAVKSRGLYFDATNYLTASVYIVLNYKFTISIWSLAISDGIVYTNGSIDLYSSSCASLYLSSVVTIKWVSSGLCISEDSAWVFTQLSVGFSSATTSLSISINQVLSTTVSFNGYAFYDYYSTYPLVGNGFSGFVYRIAIWQTDSVITDTQYSVCGSISGASCLWTCDYGYYYNEYLQACMPCETTCADLCSTWGTCAQCSQTTCSTCTNFNASCYADTPQGQCISGLIFNENGKCCATHCTDCYGASAASCLACVNGHYLLGTSCVSECSLGFSVSGNSCVASVNPYIVLSLDVIQSKVIDSASGIVFTSGSPANFYPTVNTNNPVPTVQRGYYFTTYSSLASPKVNICYNFTAIMFVYMQGTGQLFNGGGHSLLHTSAIDSNKWIVMGITSWLNINQTLTTQVQYSGTINSPVTHGTLKTSTSVHGIMYIGDSPSHISFTGFVWSLKIYSSVENASTLFAQTCIVAGNANCLWACDFNQYFAGAICSACGSDCSNSVCRRGSDCALCINSLCTVCEDYRTCTSCVANAEVNSESVCECSAGYYWDSLSETCSMCDSLCQRCTGPTLNDCYCGENSYQEGYQCICNEGYTMDNAVCLACDYRCLTCSGLTYYDCLSCSAFLMETVCLPKCPLGYVPLLNTCVLQNELALRYVFDTPQTIFTDQIQGLTALSESYSNP